MAIPKITAMSARLRGTGSSSGSATGRIADGIGSRAEAGSARAMSFSAWLTACPHAMQNFQAGSSVTPQFRHFPMATRVASPWAVASASRSVGL